MTKVIVDPVTEAKLVAARKTLEICNDRGRVLGHFVPNLDSEEVSMEPQISPDELDRRERAGGGRPFVDILADLEKRA